MASEWFYTKDGKTKIGPISSTALKTLAESGQILPTDMVCRAGMAQWITASSIKGLFSNADSTPPTSTRPEAVQAGSSALASTKVLDPLPTRQRLLTPVKIVVLGGGALLFLVCFLCSGGTAVWYFALRNMRPDYYPLKDGAKWEYEILPDGGLNGQKITFINRIEGTEKIKGKNYFKVVVVTAEDSAAQYTRKDDSGVYILVSKEKTELGELLLLPQPLDIGKEWTLGEIRFRIEGEEDVHLLDQTYKRCLKIRSIASQNGVRVIEDSYYAPNVGLVKSITMVEQKVAAVKTLKKYTP